MADRIITVTDPSVVTNDTLAGYNNYSDIDGQLGTTMTPTEATNGKTVTLSDGSVHEVTTKPVGTTNGEFSAVVSNAVTVDLSVSTPVSIDFSLGAMVDITKTGDSYQPGSLSFVANYMISEVFSGDFEYAFDVVNGLLMGIGRTNSNNAYNATTEWEYFSLSNNGVATIGLDGVDGVIDNPHTFLNDGVNNQMVLQRVGTVLKLYSRVLGVDTLLHTYGVPALGAYTGPIYLHATAGKNQAMNNPTFLQL